MADVMSVFTNTLSSYNLGSLLPNFSGPVIWMIICFFLFITLLMIILNGKAMVVFAKAKFYGNPLVEIILRDHTSIFLLCDYDPVNGNWNHYVKDASKQVVVKMTFIPNPEAVRILFGVPLLTTIEGYASGLSPLMALFMQTCVSHGITDPKKAAALDAKLRKEYAAKVDEWNLLNKQWKKAFKAKIEAGTSPSDLAPMTPLEQYVKVPNGLVINLGENTFVDWRTCESWITKIGPGQLFDLEAVNEAIAIKQTQDDKQQGDFIKFMTGVGIFVLICVVAYGMIGKSKECDVTGIMDSGYSKCEAHYARAGVVPLQPQPPTPTLTPRPQPPPAT